MPFGSTHMLDWNSRYQLLTLSRSDVKLTKLVEEFEYIAKGYGKVIVEERGMEIGMRTYTPLTAAGGVAGGEKYLVHGILFKLALDNNSIYQGSPPQKAAGWERKGMDALRSSLSYRSSSTRRGDEDDVKVHFPLSVNLDYLGHRLTATCLLPVNDKTLVHGISNASTLGSIRVLDGGPARGVLERGGERLGLSKHSVGRGEMKSVIRHAADLEVHVGTDGRCYALDTARVLPPRYPFGGGGRQRTLTELFRGEFCRRVKGGLNSDGLSGFTHPDEGEEGRRRIRDATVFLLEELVPKVAERLDEVFGGSYNNISNSSVAELVSLTEDVLLTLHRHGLNYQHLGLVRLHCKDQSLRDLLLAEMIARVGKDDIREIWREKGEGVKLPGRRGYVEGLVSYLNKLLASLSSKGMVFWYGVLQSRLQTKYSPDLFASDVSYDVATEMRARMDGYMCYVYERLKCMLEVYVNRNTDEWLKGYRRGWPKVEAVLGMEDIEGIGVKVKRQGFMESCVSGKLLREARECKREKEGGNSEGRERIRWVRAVEGLRHSLGCNVAAPEGYFRLAYGMVRLLEEEEEGYTGGLRKVEEVGRKVWEGMEFAMELGRREGEEEVEEEVGEVRDVENKDVKNNVATPMGNAKPYISSAGEGYYAPPPTATSEAPVGSTEGGLYYGNGSYGGGAYDQFYDDPIRSYDEDVGGEGRGKEEVDAGDVELDVFDFMQRPPPRAGIREGFKEYLGLARDASGGDREGVALGLNVIGSCMMFLYRFTKCEDDVMKADQAFEMASETAGFGSKEGGRRSSHRYEVGGSLVGSTMAESACRRAQGKLELARWKIERGEGGEGELEKAEGILEGLGGYLNLQGHIGGGGGGLEEEIERIGMIALNLSKKSKASSPRKMSLSFLGRKVIKCSKKEKKSAIVGIGECDEEGDDCGRGRVSVWMNNGNVKYYNHLEEEQMYMLKGRSDRGDGVKPSFAIGDVGVVVMEDGRIEDGGFENFWELYNVNDVTVEVGGHGCGLRMLDGGRIVCYIGNDGDIEGGREVVVVACIDKEGGGCRILCRKEIEEGLKVLDINVNEGEGESVGLQYLAIRDSDGVAFLSEFRVMMGGGGGGDDVVEVKQFRIEGMEEGKVEQGKFDALGSSVCLILSSGSVFVLEPGSVDASSVGLVTNFSTKLLKSPLIKDGWYLCHGSFSVTSIPDLVTLNFHYETMEGEMEGVIQDVIMEKEGEDNVKGYAVIGAGEELDVVGFKVARSKR